MPMRHTTTMMTAEEENGTLRLVYCPTADILPDTLTKALPLPKVKHFADCPGLRVV